MTTKTILPFAILLIMTSCHESKTTISDTAEYDPTTNDQDTIPKITGIGGVFFKAKDPEKVKEWYNKNLGLAVDAYGAPFEFRNAKRSEEINYLNWDPFVDTTSYFDPSEKEFMINYRVQNIEGLVDRLRKNGVVIVDEIVAYDYGKFVHLMDLEGNKIELWEPIDSVLSKFDRVTNK